MQIQVRAMNDAEARAHVKVGAYIISPFTEQRFRRLRITHAFNEPGKTVMVSCGLLKSWSDRWLHAIGFAKPPEGCYWDHDSKRWRWADGGKYPIRTKEKDPELGGTRVRLVEHGPKVELTTEGPWDPLSKAEQTLEDLE